MPISRRTLLLGALVAPSAPVQSTATATEIAKIKYTLRSLIEDIELLNVRLENVEDNQAESKSDAEDTESAIRKLKTEIQEITFRLDRAKIPY